MTKEKLEIFRLIVWINLILGVHNLYLFVANDNWFTFIVGSLNIGVWVFNRHLLFLKQKKA